LNSFYIFVPIDLKTTTENLISYQVRAGKRSLGRFIIATILESVVFPLRPHPTRRTSVKLVGNLIDLSHVVIDLSGCWQPKTVANLFGN